MKIVLDDIIDLELKDYLLTQTGICDVKIEYNNFYTILNIKYNEKINSEIIMNHIELFQKNDYSLLLEFDKGTKGNFKTMKYTAKDMCCEYCYKDLVMELFKNKQINSVRSNFDYNKPAFNIEILIEYDIQYNKNDLLEFIKEKNF